MIVSVVPPLSIGQDDSMNVLAKFECHCDGRPDLKQARVPRRVVERGPVNARRAFEKFGAAAMRRVSKWLVASRAFSTTGQS